MPFAPRQAVPIIISVAIETVSSIVGMKAASSGVIEQASGERRTSLIYGVIESFDPPFFLDYVDTFGSLDQDPFASGNGVFNFSLTADGSEIMVGAATIGIRVRPTSLIGEPAPNTSKNVENFVTANIVSIQPGAILNSNSHTNDIGAGSAYYYDELTNNDVAPEFKAIYRLLSNDVDVASPWLKPVYRTIDSEFQEPPRDTRAQRRVDTFEDDQWIVSRFAKFILSSDSFPYLVILVIIGVVIAGLRKVIQVVSSNS